jgi:hypothetical protein
MIILLLGIILFLSITALFQILIVLLTYTTYIDIPVEFKDSILDIIYDHPELTNGTHLFYQVGLDSQWNDPEDIGSCYPKSLSRLDCWFLRWGFSMGDFVRISTNSTEDTLQLHIHELTGKSWN